MNKTLAGLSLLVDDYDRAISFFTSVLGFELVEDRDLGGGKRWVVVAPPGGRGAWLLLARASTDEQRARIGDQTGGRVFLFLHTDNFAADLERLRAHGVRLTEAPRHEVYGTVVVFLDPWGNKWDLIEPVS
jgi:catechol 2,3-dioxygenase-like lactoylglutathione lyase family enzyme